MDAPTQRADGQNICEYYYKTKKKFFGGDIFTHFVGPSPSFSIATGSQLSRPSSSSPTNGFVGNTLMFSLTQRFDEKQCAYIYSVISVKNFIVKVMFKKRREEEEENQCIVIMRLV